MQSANVEIELKLIARSEDLAALYNSPIIAAHSCDRPSDRRLKTTYYDTTDQALRREGMALRVRREGRTFVQTPSHSTPSGIDIYIKTEIDMIEIMDVGN
jgi:triphosphatase